MYKKFYGLTSKPFHITPDLDFLFLSHNQQKAIACMEYGVMEDTGIILLTGEIGTGKTTLIRHMLTKFENSVRVATIYNTNVNSEQLLELIIQAFDLNSTVENKPQALRSLQVGLEDMREKGLKPVIIIDDGQNLSLKALEEIRLLSNLQSNDRMLAQIILVGQPELKEKLDDPAAASLVQRIGITYHITLFNRDETINYISHRIQIAGGDPNIFNTDALDMVFTITKGNPRAINLLCDHALVYGFADDIKNITSDVLFQVIKDNPGLGTVEGVNDHSVPSNQKSKQIQSLNRLQMANTPSKKGGPGNWQQRIETRLQTLEQLMAEYNRELRDVIKTMFEKERQRNDKLMTKYARLESESNILRQKLAKGERKSETSLKPFQ
ncbi:MAG: AAA family ATPase [Desulfobacteraceae bacterium]|jgi:type II secretory pathway predicted ATPase ExeA